MTRNVSWLIRVSMSCAIVSSFTLALFADDTTTIEPRNEPSAVFGESDVKFTYVVRSNRQFDGIVTWVHSARSRTISRGETAVMSRGNVPTEIEIPLRVPPVREGIAFDTELTVNLQSRGKRESDATHQRTVWVFPKDAFANQAEWLEAAEINLFDPEGDTVDVFEKTKIPLKEVRNVGALERLDSGLVVIGEGISFYENRALDKILPNLASKGIPVICLAPRDGSIVLPGSRDADGPKPNSISFRHTDVIAKLDKRLDSKAWASSGDLVKSHLEIASYRGLVTVEVAKDKSGWPWIEIEFAKKKKQSGKMMICGFGLIEHWDASPNSRFFLARMFEQLSGEQTRTLSDIREE